MNIWSPISREEILEEIRRGELHMEPRMKRLWRAIQIEPARWRLPPWGDLGGGFWVVGIIGNSVLWYNDIEHGFNRSRYVQPGAIAEYRCNQDELHHSLYQLLQSLDEDVPNIFKLGAPQPIDFDS